MLYRELDIFVLDKDTTPFNSKEKRKEKNKLMDKLFCQGLLGILNFFFFHFKEPTPAQLLQTFVFY